MASQDNNESVGQAGNAAAWSNFNALNARGICSNYFVNKRSPIYPERFARRGDITTAQSVAVFNELKAKGYLDKKNYWIGYSDTFLNDFSTDKTSFPILGKLTLPQQQFVLEQINLSIADHHMYSDYNRATIKFLNTQCE